MDEDQPNAGNEALLASPDAPETGADATGDGGLDVGVLVLMAVIVLLVSVQNIWLRRRAERENAEAGEDSIPTTREQ